ncbi:MAG: hypothetical protein ACI9S8_001551, partial [Chlamydiales bacterium]
SYSSPYSSSRCVAAAAAPNLILPLIPGLSLALLGFDPAYIMPRLWHS